MKSEDNTHYLVLDFETYSEANLKAVGAWECSRHPSTEVLCLAWKVGTRKTLRSAPAHSWSQLESVGKLMPLLTALKKIRGLKVVAHNAYFEQVIYQNVLKSGRYGAFFREGLPKLPPKRWVCTASLARALALPASLEKSAAVLGLKVQKDMEGAKVLKQMMKPRKPSKKDPTIKVRDPERFAKLVSYCVTDVDTETELFLTLP